MPDTWFPPRYELSRSSFLCEGRRLVGTGSPACGHGDVEHTQVHAELAAMLVPVAEHDVAQEFSARLGQDFLLTGKESPGFPHCRIVECRQRAPHRGNAFLEGLKNFVTACRLRKLEIGSLSWIFLHGADHPSGNNCEMIGKLASGHGLLVRLPRQLVFGQPLQKFPSDGRLYFKLCEQC